MNNARINDAIELTYPDGFSEMKEEELAKYFGKPDDRWGVHNYGNHTILSVAWHKAWFFTDAETALIGAEGRLRRNLLNYQRVTSYRTKITKKVQGYAIRFEYRVNDAALVQVCDLVVFKYKKKVYSLYFICRKNDAQALLPSFEEVLKSIKLI